MHFQWPARIIEHSTDYGKQSAEPLNRLNLFRIVFSAQAASFSSTSKTTKLPERITALRLLSNFDAQDGQCACAITSSSSAGTDLGA